MASEKPLTDADYAYLRFVEFGALPPRVLPDEYVELIETDSPHDRPDSAPSPQQSQALYPSGG